MLTSQNPTQITVSGFCFKILFIYLKITKEKPTKTKKIIVDNSNTQ